MSFYKELLIEIINRIEDEDLIKALYLIADKLHK